MNQSNQNNNARRKERSLVGWLMAEFLAIVVFEIARAIGEAFAYVVTGRRRT